MTIAAGSRNLALPVVRARTRSLVYLLAAATAGCGADRLGLTLPPLGAAEAILLAATADEAFTTVAADLDEFGFVTFETPGSNAEETEVHLLAFECRLERLGLIPGLDPPRPEIPRIVPVPQQKFVLSSRFDAPTTEWSAVANVPEHVQRALPLELHATRPCVSFDRSIERVAPSPIGLNSVVTLPDGDVFVTGNLCHRVTEDSILEVDTSTACTTRASFVDESGDVWLVDITTGRLARWNDPSGFERVSAEYDVPLPAGVDRAFGIGISGSVSSGQIELFAAVQIGGGPLTEGSRVTLLWFREQQWQTILEPMPVLYGGPPVVQWLSPGRAVIGVGSHAGLLHVQDGRIFEQVLPSGALDRPNVFLVHPSLGLVIGTRAGAIVTGQPGEWVQRRAPVALGSLPINSLQVLDSGLLFTNTRSDVLQWFPEDEDCEGSRALLDGVQGTVSAHRLHDDYLLVPAFSVPGPEESRNGEVHRVHRVASDPCLVDDGSRGSGWDE